MAGRLASKSTSKLLTKPCCHNAYLSHWYLYSHSQAMDRKPYKLTLVAPYPNISFNRALMRVFLPDPGGP